MKDEEKKSKETYRLNESWFDDFHNRMKNTIKPGYNTSKNAQQLLKKHGQDLESGAECKGISKGPNNLFFSNVGSSEALIGKNRNKVEDIGDLKISKRELRCYDLTKDKYGIAWLFADNAKFQAKKIWGQPGDIHFEGVWEAGVFKGAWHGPQENFKTSPQNYQGTGWNPNAQGGNGQQTQNGPNTNPQPIEYLLYLNGHHTQKTLPEVIQMLAMGQIDPDNTQIYRDGVSKNRQYVILSTLPEYPQIQSSVQRFIASRNPGTP